jgi:hypothetical protein
MRRVKEKEQIFQVEDITCGKVPQVEKTSACVLCREKASKAKGHCGCSV